MEKNEVGQFLKEVSVDFVIEDFLTIEKAIYLLQDLVKEIKSQVVRVTVNNLYPGFDVAITIKESIVYLGYWPEHKFCHLIISSCKDFEASKVVDFLKDSLNIVKLNYSIQKNFKIKDLVCQLEKI